MYIVVVVCNEVYINRIVSPPPPPPPPHTHWLQVEDEIEKARKKGVPVAAVVVEPIQAEGGQFVSLVFLLHEVYI